MVREEKGSGSMSGGRFNYVYTKADDAQEALSGLSDLRDLEAYLREIEEHNAADEVLLYLKELETHRRRIEAIGRRISGILKATEWHGSGDWSKDSITHAYNRLMGLENDAD